MKLIERRIKRYTHLLVASVCIGFFFFIKFKSVSSLKSIILLHKKYKT